MEIIINPPRRQWDSLCHRNSADSAQLEQAVGSIIKDVKTRGDEAIRDFARKFDGVELTRLRLSEQEISDGAAATPPEVAQAIDDACRNIELFHRAQLPREVNVEVMPGVRCVQKAVAINRVGLYIPGGKAPLFSTVLMLAIPSAIAGCREVALFTPEGKTGIAPAILYAAKKCGIREIYRIGGAQAIAAMAYGTDEIARVDKIFGPGNQFVTRAKQMVSADVAIDMPAGPSEVMVVADETANAGYCAADLLSQAEHGPDSQAILVCGDESFAREVLAEIDIQKKKLSRESSVEGSLSKSRAIILSSRDEMLDFANAYAPEHLILSLSNPWEAAEHITAAGSVFIGNYSPESAGDYASGTNHTLPTSGWARSMAGVNTESFMHKITFQQLTQSGLGALSKTIISMAEAEGLDAHAAAVKIRIEKS